MFSRVPEARALHAEGAGRVRELRRRVSAQDQDTQQGKVRKNITHGDEQ